MRFRPCIDLHAGTVKQIVGGSLRDDNHEALETNFVSEHDPEWFADLYRADGLRGGHVIMLGKGNEDAARAALDAYPGGLQVGGGITAGNAALWLDAGASHVIVTSYVFRDGEIHWDRLSQLRSKVGAERLVIDLSCRRFGDRYLIVTDRWQRFTHVPVSHDTLQRLSVHCCEFLVHGVDVEGLGQGLDPCLVRLLAESSPLPTTYAGGISTAADLDCLESVGGGRLDFTVGTALDIFGGTGLEYRFLVERFSRES